MTLRATSSPRSASWAINLRRDLLAGRASLGERRDGRAAQRRERPVDDRGRVRITFERAALAERIHRRIVGRIDENVTTLAAATVFAFDERIADDDPAADAGAEREKNEAVVLLCRARPELAVSGRVRIVRKRDGHTDVVAHAIANRKIPPAGQIAGPQDHALANIHRPRRREAGANDSASLNASFLNQLLARPRPCERRRLQRLDPARCGSSGTRASGRCRRPGRT